MTRELSSYAFNNYGFDAKLYNGIHDLETELGELQKRDEQVRVKDGNGLSFGSCGRCGNLMYRPARQKFCNNCGVRLLWE